MRLNDCIADYLAYIQYERKLSKVTCLHYKCWLGHFMNWLKANDYTDPDISVFSTPVLRRYRYHKSKARLRPQAVRLASPHLL